MKRTLFTLVELMVIISIIAILSTMLFSAMNTALDNTKLVECTGSLRDIFFAQQEYAADHSNWYVPSKDESITNRWKDWCFNEEFAQYFSPDASVNENGLRENWLVQLQGCSAVDTSGNSTRRSYAMSTFNILADKNIGGMTGSRVSYVEERYQNSDHYGIRTTSSLRTFGPSDILWIADMPSWNPGNAPTSISSNKWKPKVSWNSSSGGAPDWNARHDKQETRNVLFLDGHIRDHGYNAFGCGLVLGDVEYTDLIGN